MTAPAPAWLPERRKQVWEIGLNTGLILGFGANALLTGAALSAGSPLASDPALHLLFGALLLPMALLLIHLFRRSNRRGEQA
jgi:hypothetical protein